MKSTLLIFGTSAGVATVSTVGPFDSADAANHYGENTIGGKNWLAVELREPNDNVQQIGGVGQTA